MKVIYEAGLDQLIKHIKTALNGKEPTFSKNSGFNKTKTDAVENDTNKLFTAKGAYDLKNTITTAYTSLVNTTKSALETSINTKLSHGGYGGTAQSLKTDIDSKLPNPGFGGVHELGRYLDLHFSGSTADYDARISVASDKSVSVGNSFGTLEIGPKNTSHCHIYTDRPSFYFNKELNINGNRVYHLGFKPSKADVGLGSVNDWGASSDIGANSTTQYATTNMVNKVKSLFNPSWKHCCTVKNTEATTSGYTINTAIPYNSSGMYQVKIEGYAYGESKPVMIDLVFYVYQNSFTNTSYFFYGYDPGQIVLFHSNGNIKIFIPGNVYYNCMHVYGICGTNGDSARLNGWTFEINGQQPTGTQVSPIKRTIWSSYNFDPNSKLNANANAVSSTKLLNVRTINGTNFDGTGNIVTANWGTARTFTIGNTGKSVNGSGNISWSLSEIGAVALAGSTMSGTLYSSTNYLLKSTLSSCAIYSSGDEMGFTRADNAWVLRYNKSSGNVTFTNTPYVGGSLIYHQGNKPSKADVGLSALNNWGASSSISANSTAEYATTNMVAQVRAEKANSSHTHVELRGSNYISGGNELPNYFGAGKFKYQMLKAGSSGSGGTGGGVPGSSWSDCLWVSSYTGGDVKLSNLLCFSKATNKIGFRQQNYDSTTWGAFNEIYHTGYKPTATDVGALPSTYCPYRVGDILTTKNTANPAVTWPGTTWKKIEGRFLYGSSTAGQTGGSSTKSLSVANMPSHNHPASGSSNSTGAHTHTANHNHTASQSAHAHTQPAHTHQAIDYSPSYRATGTGGDYNVSGGTINRKTGSAGSENTGSATPAITVNTTNVTTSSTGAHSHTISVSIGSSGSGSAFDIMPPYETVHIWERLS